MDIFELAVTGKMIGSRIDALEARVEALEPEKPLANYFDASVFANESHLVTYYSDTDIRVSSMGIITEQPFSAFCPKAKVGETYTLTVKGRYYDPWGQTANGCIDTGEWATSLDIWYSSDYNDGEQGKSVVTFVLTQELYDAPLRFDVPENLDMDENGEMVYYPATAEFEYFQMNQGEVPLPYEPYPG